MPGDDLVARIAVGDRKGPRSATFRIWSPKGKSDVYAAVRDIAGKIKISLHESGECNAGLTNQFGTQEAGAVAAIGGSRHQSQWTRLTHTGGIIVTPLQFFIPASELREWRKTTPDKKTIWIAPPTLTQSIIISCIFSGQCFANGDWPGRQNGTRIITSKLLPNGEKFWLLWQDCPTSEMEQTMLRKAKARMATTNMVQFSRPKEHFELPTSTLIFMESKRDRRLLVLDAAVLGPNDGLNRETC